MKPVFQCDSVRDASLIFNLKLIPGKWYFWDENWRNTHGPFDAEAPARSAYAGYFNQLPRMNCPTCGED